MTERSCLDMLSYLNPLDPQFWWYAWRLRWSRITGWVQPWLVDDYIGLYYSIYPGWTCPWIFWQRLKVLDSPCCRLLQPSISWLRTPYFLLKSNRCFERGSSKMFLEKPYAQEASYHMTVHKYHHLVVLKPPLIGDLSSCSLQDAGSKALGLKYHSLLNNANIPR